MTKGAKIGLVVGIAAILLIVVVMSQQPKVVNSNTNSSGAGYLPGLFALGAGLGKSIFDRPTAPVANSPYDPSLTSTFEKPSSATEQAEQTTALGFIPGFGFGV